MGLATRLLGDISDEADGTIRTGPFGSQLHESDYVADGIPVVMPKNIVEGNVSISDIAMIRTEDADRLSQHRLKPGDIVYGRRGDIGRRAYISERENGWLCGTGCLRISLDKSSLDSKFLYYYLGQHHVIGWIYNQAVGATMPNLNTKILQSIPITYPPLQTQRKIASVLSAYDDLIENNTRRIQILEETAQAIYREWFVNFRFPVHEKVGMVDSPLGKIPEGWMVEKLEHVCTSLKSGGTPARKESNYWKGNTSWFKTKELRDSFLFESEESITEEGLRKSSAKIFPEDTVLMAIYAAPTVGRLGILTKPATFNQAMCGLVADHKKLTTSFLYLKLHELRLHFNNLAQGAAQQNISVEKVRNSEIVLPEPELINDFDAIASPLLSQTRILSEKVSNLRRTRDLLLPKLISGEIGLDDKS